MRDMSVETLATMIKATKCVEVMSEGNTINYTLW